MQCNGILQSDYGRCKSISFSHVVIFVSRTFEKQYLDLSASPTKSSLRTTMEASKATSDESELVLHVWPGKWDLPSIDAQCLAAVLFAQVTIPGKFVVEECIDPDSSPNGLLPYCTHGEAIVVSYPSIAKYISGIATSNEPSESEEDGVTPILATLTCTQKAQQIAWLSFVSANLGDLVVGFCTQDTL